MRIDGGGSGAARPDPDATEAVAASKNTAVAATAVRSKSLRGMPELLVVACRAVDDYFIVIRQPCCPAALVLA